MSALDRTAPTFVAMAHTIGWASVATVDSQGRPRTRVLHPYWEWDGTSLTGWIGHRPHRHQEGPHRRPALYLTYWAPTQDTCSAEATASSPANAQNSGEVQERT